METGLNTVNRANYGKNFISHAPFCNKKAVSKTYTPNAKALQAQLNFMGINNRVIAFKGREDKYSYDNFKAAARSAGLYTYDDIEKEINPKNLIGSGSHSEVYKFSDPRLDKWVLKVDKDKNDAYFSKAPDDFDDINIGQEIAATWKKYAILKKIEGKPHSLENWSERAKDGVFRVTNSEAEEFCTSIEKIADFPQSTFDDYAKQLRILSDKGYKMDSINPNNLLIDYDNEKISIIDFFKSRKTEIKNSRLDLINSLFDFSFFREYHAKIDENKRESFMKACRQIIDKCNNAAEKAGISTGTRAYTDYLKWVDDIYEMDDSNSHMRRYRGISGILPEINRK